ncbi:MAG: leucine--tRNA ligase [Ideonella sp.]|nr:leucine--tRNA ligase [Ideonella sp.]MCC7455853.1 leucine--tRNA ligase [Nitrospira sp.]
MKDKYVPAEVEAAAQARWSARDAYRVGEDPGRKKFYACSMLPYPSGALHMGHVRNYTINDMLARHKRMQGFNVLMPMGWDAFGLPAENAAMKSKVAPGKWTRDNIALMKARCQSLGLAIDWSRELATCDPEYYKWNQWFFLKCLECGIAYRKTQIVNWDPVDQTVLANEQVIDGHGWRSGAPVEKREIPGYYFNITKYAEELLDCTLHKLPGWSERLRLIQENWIGRSEGVNFGFPYTIDGADQLLRVYTTRADTIMGVSFVAIAAEHPLAKRLARDRPALVPFIDKCKQGSVMEADMATMEKEGMPTGFRVTHPLTGAQVEVWIGNYVLMAYGEGAVMGVPAHDERDFAFAKKYGLPIPQVIAVPGETFSTAAWADWYADKQRGVCVNSGKYDGLAHEAAVAAIAADLAAKGLGRTQVQYRLRDWGISRQRYWGTPIPVIHCGACGVVPVPYEDLPVVLPEDLVPDGSGSPLTRCEAFLACTCPKCGQPARRETDTMDTFVDSAWYYMRYASADAPTMVDARNDHWMPMDVYIGGIEHAVLHLLYARFWTKVMRDMGLLRYDEPFVRMVNHGMLLNHIYYTVNAKGGKDYVPPAEVKPTHDAHGHIVGGTTADGTVVEYGGVGKMGKTERNGVDPQDLIDQYGADTARLFVMFVGGPEDASVWSDTGVEGSSRFLRRLWQFAARHAARLRAAGAMPSAPGAAAAALRRTVHAELKQIRYDYERMQYNTVVSGAMKLLNALEDFAPETDADAVVLHEGTTILLRVLYPACPHITQVLWQELGFEQDLGDLLDAPMPAVDEAALVRDEIELVLQIAGKTRGSVRVSAQADQAAIERAALASAEFAKFGDGKPAKKVVIVPGRLVNVVV